MRKLLAVASMFAFLMASVVGCNGENAPSGDGEKATLTEDTASQTPDEEPGDTKEDDWSDLEPSAGGTGSTGIGE